MKNWIFGLFVASVFTPMAPAQISVVIGMPPPLRYEAPPPLPGPGFVWIDGFWQPDGPDYRWIAGHYARAPYPGAYWYHPHYDHYDDGWRFHEGHWDHEDHDHGHHGEGHGYGHRD
ncbi:MAG TPA: hypothetical protein VGR96_17470 [Acidobacteriaceae bacterium]|nr:hypothetical protein [Acidobacteriaceae bacterium]